LEIYTALIDALIGSVYKAVEQSPSIEVTNGMLPMVTLIEAKEHGGLERALGAALLNQAAAGAADPATYASYYSRLNNETNALDRFRAHGNAEHNRWLREALVGPDVRQVLIWREILQKIVATNDPQGVSGTAWFNAATKRLNRISEVEMRIGGRVTEVLAEQDAAIVSRLWMLASLGGLAILSAIALAAYAGTSAARGLRIVARVIEGLASGDTRVEQTKRRDEVGNILTDLKSLGDRLAASANAADSVSKGYLSGEIPIASDMDRLGNALQVMQHTLNDMAQQTSSMITELTMQSEMLTDMAGEVAHGASEQSRATQSAAAAVEEMNATMRVSSDNASETNEIAAKAADKARGSGVAVARAADAMKKITERIGVVMEIARQTDLLALNAAVEAARAGEHGRGFSVVAQEVRKLAENSGKAAEEIEQLVRQTVDESNNAKQKIDAMLPDILRTSELVAEIVAAMSEQEQGIGQISNALNSLSMANAKSENMGRYSADAAKEVQSIVVRLQEMQGFYKTDEVPMSERISTADNEANAALRAA
ncbi:MAG: methyl-accepting chemotaxis protein, partial [Pseudomonadota bacterium]